MRYLQHSLRVILGSFLLSGSAFAITSADLAAYLGVRSWTTSIFLDPGSYTVEIYEIKDGEAGNLLIAGDPRWGTETGGCTIIMGSENGTYKVMLLYKNGVSISALSKVAGFTTSMSPSLPEKIREGDYVIIGQLREMPRNTAKISNFSSGFLLRVKLVNKDAKS